MKEQRIPVRIEDLAPLATELSIQYNNNKSDFEDYSTDFTPAFATDFSAKITSVEKAFSSSVLIGEMVLLTKNMKDKLLSARPLITRIEGNLKGLENKLSVDVSKFDFKGIRKSINGGDTEGFSSKMTTLVQLCDNNKTVLESKGIKPEHIEALKQIIVDLKTLSVEYSNKNNDKEKFVKENNASFLSLWKDCAMIMDAGKRIYKYDKPENLKYFTRTQIIKKLRHDGSKAKEVKAE